VDESEDFVAMIEEYEGTFNKLLNSEVTLDTVLASEIVNRISEQLGKRKMELCARSKTSKLWLNYQNMLKVARSLV